MTRSKQKTIWPVQKCVHMQRTRLAYMWCCIRYGRFGVSYQTGTRVMLFEKIINCCLHFEELNWCGKTGNVAIFSVWIKILPEKDISGRIKTNCNTWFGCCHNGGRFSPQIHFGVPCEGTFLDMKKSLNPARREGWRLWSSSWTLAICASWHWLLLRWSNCFVIVNIKRSEPPPAKVSAHFFKSNWGLTVHRQHSFYF